MEIFALSVVVFIISLMIVNTYLVMRDKRHKFNEVEVGDEVFLYDDEMLSKAIHEVYSEGEVTEVKLDDEKWRSMLY